MVDAPELPEWLKDLRGLRPYVDELREFASDPTTYILEIVLTSIVGWILTGTEIVIGSIQTAFRPLLGVPQTITGPLLTAGGTITAALGGVIATLNSVIVSVSMAAGPFAPVVVVVVWGGVAILAVETAKLGLKSLPLVIPWL